MSADLFEDLFVVVSVTSLVGLGLVITVASGWPARNEGVSAWRRGWNVMAQTVLTVAGWGATLALVQHVVGPRF